MAEKIENEKGTQLAAEGNAASQATSQAKRPVEGDADSARVEDKKSKKPRRRRNYDDLDEKVAEEDKTSSTLTNDKDENSDSEVDDEKLDQIMAKEDEEEDDLSEIDTSNIITTGRRTRGKIIDYKKTAEQLEKSGEVAKDENEDDDENDGEFKEAAFAPTSASTE